MITQHTPKQVVAQLLDFVIKKLQDGNSPTLIKQLLIEQGAQEGVIKHILDRAKEIVHGQASVNNQDGNVQEVKRLSASQENSSQIDSSIAQSQLLVIGDSHSRFWGGGDTRVEERGANHLPGIVAEIAGPGLAWNLVKEESTARGREKTLACIHSALSCGFRGWVMLSFGEIDIRCHILKSAAEIGMTNAVAACVNRYIAFTRELQQIHNKVAIWGPVASTNGEIYNPELPFIGTELERNYATVMFTEMLQQWSDVPVLSPLYPTLLNNGRTNTALLYDGTHLSQKVLPYALDLAHQKLGLDLSEFTNIFGSTRQNISRRVIFQRQTYHNQPWMMCNMQSIAHVHSIGIIGPANYDAANPFSIMLTDDNRKIFTIKHDQPLHINTGHTEYIPIDRSTRFLYVPYGAADQPNISIYAMVNFLNLNEMQSNLSPATMLKMVQMAIG